MFPSSAALERYNRAVQEERLDTTVQMVPLDHIRQRQRVKVGALEESTAGYGTHESDLTAEEVFYKQVEKEVGLCWKILSIGGPIAIGLIILAVILF